jgi:malonyl-CoA O-methyltransferase
MTEPRPPTIDPAAAARWQQRPQSASAWLHEEVGRRMEQRLDWIVRQPRSLLHWEPVRGGLQAQALLTRRYPAARARLHAELAPERRRAQQLAAGPWWQPRRWLAALRPAAAAAPADLLWANMTLHMAAEPQALIRRWHESLAVEGWLMFSCFGPDTLRELRALYQAQGWPPPAHEFTDMHDWGDMLVAAGFAEPVMDMERIELTFETPERLLQELRELGRNLHPARFAGLRGRGWRERFHQALRRQLADPAHGGRLKLTFEIIYGHAFKPPRRLAVGGETTLSVDEMRAALRSPRAPRT